METESKELLNRSIESSCEIIGVKEANEGNPSLQSFESGMKTSMTEL